MIALRAARLSAIALFGAAAGAGVAVAQSAGTPTGNFGGGALAVPVKKTVAKDMVLSFRALPDRRLRVEGHMFARCGMGTIRGATRIAGDGRFRLRATATRAPLVGVSEITTFVVKGRLMATSGNGTASLKIRERSPDGTTRACKSRTLNWQVRRPSPAAAVASAPAEATLYGLTSQRGRLAKRPIVLRAARGGRSIDRLMFGYRPRCDRRRIVSTDEVHISPKFAVAADGSFRKVERFKVTYADSIMRATAVVSGRFDQHGAASGKLRVVQRYVKRSNGRRVDICSSGTRSWSARP